LRKPTEGQRFAGRTCDAKSGVPDPEWPFNAFLARADGIVTLKDGWIAQDVLPDAKA
jgi:hypothetical protein